MFCWKIPVRSAIPLPLLSLVVAFYLHTSVTLFTGLKDTSLEKEVQFGMPLLAKSSTNVTAERQKKMFSDAAEPGAPWHRPEISSISFQQRSSARFKKVSNPITKIATVSWKDADLILVDLSPKGRSQRFPSVQERVRF